MPTLAIYLDQDGVLADFETGARALIGAEAACINAPAALLSPTAQAAKQSLIDQLRTDRTFNYRLPVLPDAHHLVAHVARFRPTILTAVTNQFHTQPDTLAAAAVAKWAHCAQHFGFRDPADFICTTSDAKPRYLGYRPAAVQLLIDDRAENCAAWIAAGGLAIQHRSVRETLRAFAELERLHGPFTPWWADVATTPGADRPAIAPRARTTVG